MFPAPVLDQTRIEFAQPASIRSAIPVNGLASSVQLKRGWDEVIRELSMLHSLEDDWDGSGAAAPHHHVILSAVQLAKLLSAQSYELPDSCTATPSGTILFEWHNEQEYKECEVFAHNDVAFMSRDSHGNYHHGKIKMPPLGFGRMPCINA